jgi:transcriptional regulator
VHELSDPRRVPQDLEGALLDRGQAARAPEIPAAPAEALSLPSPTIACVYTPRHNAVDPAAAAEFLSRIEAADLVTLTDQGLEATFLPLLYVPAAGEHGVLRGHLARKNGQWQRPAIGEALVIARAEDAYIHPGWYPSKAEHGRVVPTWNYRTAHVYGELVVHDDPAWVDENVRGLTSRQESRREHPWSVDDAPPAFHEGQLRAIVGVEVLISRVEAKFKMSQNQNDANIDGVIAGLEGDGRAEVAELVQRLRPERS